MESSETLNIEPGKASNQYWRDLWRYRELFAFLAWRDILVRYKQTVIGIAWAVLRPLLTMVILTFVFTIVAKMEGVNNVPYPLLVLCGLLPWQFFAAALTESGVSLVQNANMISKIYFPRLIVPTSSVVTSLVDFTISAIILGLMMVFYQFAPSSNIVWLPLFILLAFAFALGGGLWISALMVRYRDFRIIVPFIVQFGLYISPVGFASSEVPEKWRLLYSVNPMVGVVDGFRWCLLGQDIQFEVAGLVMSIIFVAIVFLTGIAYFRKTEREFADII